MGLGESSDPNSVMAEYLSSGSVRRSFTAGNLTAINSDADRFMKIDGKGSTAANAPEALATVGNSEKKDSGAIQNGSIAPVLVSLNHDNGNSGVALQQGWLLPTDDRFSDALPHDRIPASVFEQTVPNLFGRGSDRDDILIGGVGDGLLMGREGRDFLIGGIGAAALQRMTVHELRTRYAEAPCAGGLKSAGRRAKEKRSSWRYFLVETICSCSSWREHWQFPNRAPASLAASPKWPNYD